MNEKYCYMLIKKSFRNGEFMPTFAPLDIAITETRMEALRTLAEYKSRLIKNGWDCRKSNLFIEKEERILQGYEFVYTLIFTPRKNRGERTYNEVVVYKAPVGTQIIEKRETKSVDKSAAAAEIQKLKENVRNEDEWRSLCLIDDYINSL